MAIAPFDDSIDTNLVSIEGSAVIGWFGDAAWVTKRIIFAQGLALKHNPPLLVLLGGMDREITSLAIGTYSCDGEGHWMEVQFTETGARDITCRLDAIAQRLDEIERMLKR